MFFLRKKSKDKESTAFISKMDILKIKEQLEKQVEILHKVGVLQILSDEKTLGMLGIDNKEYSVPTLQEVLLRLGNKKELVEKKIKQGFTKIIMVPFACPLEIIIKKYEETIIAHYNEGKLLATKEKITDIDEKLNLDLNQPINIWNECKDGDVKNKFIYFPKIYDKINHQGKTKLDLLLDPKNAWQIYLIEDMPNIPLVGKGKKIEHRRQIETNKTPMEYLEIIQTNKIYQGEEGLTPEADLIYAIIYLEETNQVINDWQGKGNVSYELGALVSSDNVSWLGWDRDFNRADLWKLDIWKKDPRSGARVGIRG